MDEIRFLLRFIAAGKEVLAARVALFITLILTFILFGYVMIQPDYWRLGGATLFAILVFLPVIRLESRQMKEMKNVENARSTEGLQ